MALVRRSPRRALAVLALAGALVVAGVVIGWNAWVDYNLRAGELALERRDTEAAWKYLTRCLAAAPSNGKAHFLAARTARRSGRWDDAEAHLAACRRLGYDEERVNLERVLTRVQRGDPGGEPYLRERLAGDDADAVWILEVLIDRYIHTYRLWAALDAFRRYLELRPDDVKALLSRAQIYLQIYYYGSAEPDLRRAVAVAPDNSEARRGLAELLLIRGTPQEAADHFEWLRARQPDDASALVGLAQARRKLTQYDEARRLLSSVLARDPHHAGALTELGLVALDEGTLGEAEALFRQAVERAPHDRAARDGLCRCLRLAGREEEARSSDKELARLDAELKLLDELTLQLFLHPEDIAARHKIAVAFLRNGEEEKGLRWLKTVLEMAPNYKPAHESLADYYERKGDKEGARLHREMARRP